MHTISQLQYGSRHYKINGIFDTLRENSQTEASVGFILLINPKLTLLTILKQKVDKICTWLDLDDSDTKELVKEITSNNNTTQKIVISVFDIHFKLFDSSIGDDRFTTTVYERRTSPEHAPILKNALYKAIHPYNHSAIQFIPNGIQGMTNKDVY